MTKLQYCTFLSLCSYIILHLICTIVLLILTTLKTSTQVLHGYYEKNGGVSWFWRKCVCVEWDVSGMSGSRQVVYSQQRQCCWSAWSWWRRALDHTSTTPTTLSSLHSSWTFTFISGVWLNLMWYESIYLSTDVCKWSDVRAKLKRLWLLSRSCCAE